MTDSEKYPADLLFSKDHDWARVEGEEATFGITWYAQSQLGEIVYWEGAKIGEDVTQNAAYTELESVKAVSEVIAPLSGTVLEVNEAALESPDWINESPYERGWLVRVSLSTPGEADGLLSAGAYKELVES